MLMFPAFFRCWLGIPISKSSACLHFTKVFGVLTRKKLIPALPLFADEISAHYTWRNYFLTRQLTSSDCGQSPYIFAFEVKNEEEFNSRILHAQIPIIVQFFAEWCDPTTNMIPELQEEISRHPGELMAASVDVDKFPKLAYQYKVFSIPALILFQNGEVIETCESMEEETVKSLIKQALTLT